MTPLQVGTYQHCRQVWSDSFQFAVTAYEGVPYLVVWGCFVLFHHDEERAVPSCHAIGLFVPEYQVLKVVLGVATVVLCIGKELLVVLATSIGRRPYVQLLDYQLGSTHAQLPSRTLTTQLGVCSAFASQYSWYLKPLI